ncbi:MAG TPA: VCBS repeat-containing protein, partial [Spirochaetia bacterium]|nr:VCBS repeat-containing protein [Spirochaetia bacterium]
LCDDFNRDGRVDVIVAKNSTRATGIMERIVAYDQGEVLCLHWDGSDLTPNWSTGLLNGYVTDYGIFDLDGDGKLELFVISVSETGLLGKTKNRLTAYRLAQPQ